jgi:2-polyprenyl-6-methoxyphenol hydroxylase-like FAD-dependent oxidoreductase
MPRRPKVLVVGAGPTGLATALTLRDHGASVRVVERRPDAFRPSRAMVLHPRTLEMLRPARLTDALLERADLSPSAELHLGSRRVHVALADLALPDTAFPHLTMIRQMEVETMLADALLARGTEVERGTSLVDVVMDTDGEAVALLHSRGREERFACAYVVGCDGPSSTVRTSAGIGWEGAPYHEEVVLADVELAGDLTPGVLHAVPARDGLVFAFFLGEQAPWRLLATRPRTGGHAAFGQPGEPVDEADLERLVEHLGASLGRVAWSARVPLQHRLADSYRRGRLFLAGDAAHVHSPAAAQGMNTGIQDGVNLGWKLALALGSDHKLPALLDSYEAERRQVARLVLAMTHAVFFAEASTNPLAGLFRERVVPFLAPVLPALLRQQRLLAPGIRVLGGLPVRHRSSPLSLVPSSRGRWHAGDRLPDAPVTSGGDRVRLHDLTATPHVHVLLDAGAPVAAHVLSGPHVAVHRLDQPGRGATVVRPDGFVGLSTGVADEAELGAWLDLVGAR